jgi:hypothetical protein
MVKIVGNTLAGNTKLFQCLHLLNLEIQVDELRSNLQTYLHLIP